MPNFCSNRLSMPPSPGIRNIINALRGPNGAIDFEIVLPIPKPLRDIHRGGQHIEGAYHTRWREEIQSDDRIKRIHVPEKERADLRKRFDADCPLDWCIRNWGSKWNAICEGAEWKDNAILFDTAWNPPRGFVEALSRKFQNTRFELRFVEPGCGLNGRVLFLQGEIQREEAYAMRSDAGIENLERVGLALPEPI